MNKFNIKSKKCFKIILKKILMKFSLKFVGMINTVSYIISQKQIIILANLNTNKIYLLDFFNIL